MRNSRSKWNFSPAPLLACVFLYAPLALAKEAPNIPPATHRWTLADFGGVLSVGLEGHRNYEAGLRLYRAHCGNCHTIGRHGDRPSKTTGNGPLDPLPQAAVLDLLAFVLSGADPKSPFFFQP
jgi:mono/diheme cytochrome c family protein